MFMLTLHSANIFSRRLSDWELTEGVAEFKKYLIAAKESGEVQIEGKMRDYIASAVGVSTGKAAQMESITNNLCEEGKEAFKNGKMNFTTAYETSRLPEEKQKEVIESGEMLSGEVKKMVEEEKKKKEPTPAAVKKFYEAHAKRYDGDRSKLMAFSWLIRAEMLLLSAAQMSLVHLKSLLSHGMKWAIRCQEP